MDKFLFMQAESAKNFYLLKLQQYFLYKSDFNFYLFYI